MNITQQVWRIAERSVAAWHSRCGSGNLETPLSVIAALSMISERSGSPTEIRKTFLALDSTEFAAAIGQLWFAFSRSRPDLINRVWPLMSVWHDREHPPSEQQLLGAHAVGHAALTSDLFSVTATERRHDADVLGSVLTHLRPVSALQGRGQFYTPVSVSDLIGRMTLPAEGETVVEPTAGTGGLFRAAAEGMRAVGLDPTTCTWVAADIDPVAIACLGVNAVSWRLGPNVILGVGDALADDWQARALAERRETVDLDRSRRMAEALLGFEQATAPPLTTGPAAGTDTAAAAGEPDITALSHDQVLDQVDLIVEQVQPAEPVQSALF